MDAKGVVVLPDVGGRVDTGRFARPLALEHVANRPIAHHVLEALESAGVVDVVVVCARGGTRCVRECLEARESRGPGQLRYVEQSSPVSLIDAIRVAAPLIGPAPCVFHLASGLLPEPLEPIVDLIRGDSPDLILTVHQRSAPTARLSAATREVLHLAELDPQRAALGMAGVCAFGPGGLRCAQTAAWRVQNEVDLSDVDRRVCAAGGRIEVLSVNAWREYTGDPLDLLELNRIALDRIDMGLPRPTNNINRIEGRVWIHEQASVHASVIVGPAVIGPRARIKDAYIGPYTSIGAGAEIEGAEIERSIISSGASILHIGGRLVASVVGRDARVFRDFSLPRALRLRVGEGTEVALC